MKDFHPTICKQNLYEILGKFRNIYAKKFYSNLYQLEKVF